MRVSRSRSFPRVTAMLLLAVTLALGSLLVTPTAQAQKIKPNFWGMHDDNWATPPNVPVGSADLQATGTSWTAVETFPGRFSWTRLSAQVKAAEAKGAQPMIVLGRTPRFHSSKPLSRDYDKYMPNITAWKRYVSAVAAKFGTRLDYQIWPEPNIPQNWLGTPHQMAQLTMVAAKAIHQKAGKKAKVVAPAMPIRLRGQRAWAAKYYKQSIGGKRVSRYIDVVAVDPYPEESGTPEDSLKLVQTIRKKLAAIGVKKPIWSAEINYGVVGGYAPADRHYSVAKQQSYVIRTYVLSAAARVQRTYWLAWVPVPDVAIQMSNRLGLPLPPAKSYEVVRSWLNGTNFGGCATKNGLWVCTASKGRTEVRKIYWKPTGATTIRTPRSTTRVENQNGGVKTRRGSYNLRVDYRPIMVASKKVPTRMLPTLAGSLLSTEPSRLLGPYVGAYLSTN